MVVDEVVVEGVWWEKVLEVERRWDSEIRRWRARSLALSRAADLVSVVLSSSSSS